MTDIVTEFINVSNLTYDDLLAGVTVVNNSATESAVVKDVLISNPSGRTLSLLVGGATVATVGGDSRLTGGELIGSNAKLQLKTQATPSLNEFYSSGYQSVKKFLSPTLFDSDTSDFQAVASSNLVVTPLAAATHTFMCFDSAGNFYYACNGNVGLYKRAGGVNGAQTFYNFGNCGFCFDGDRYIYSFSGSTVFSFDTSNSLITSKQCGVSTDYRYSYASALDGWIYLSAGYESEVSYLVQAASGSTVSAPGFWRENTQAYYVGLGKDNKGNYICFQNSPSPQLQWWNIGPSPSTPVIRQSGSIVGFANGYATSNGVVQFTRQVGSYSIFYFIGRGAIFQFDINSKLIKRLWRIEANTVSDGPSFVPKANINFANSDFGGVGIRVTGIKTTL